LQVNSLNETIENKDKGNYKLLLYK
jgi:hypothetical protein